MGFLVNERKVRAASASMHQFCQQVRGIFPGPASDKVVEAATIYLYLILAQDLFGMRFADKLQRKLRRQLKYCSAKEAEAHLAGIVRRAATLERAAESRNPNRSPEDIVRTHVVCVIESMLTDAGFNDVDTDLAKKAYQAFETAVKNIRRHLLGIKEQNFFLMRSPP
jgi:hypothetical protein